MSSYEENKKVESIDAQATKKGSAKRLTVSRRDVLKAAWTVPIVMAVAPPTALAAGSGYFGNTPGFWMQEDSFEYWPEPYEPEGGSYGEVFEVETDLDLNLSQSLDASYTAPQTEEEKLARSATAALLNAANPNINYPYTEAEVTSLVQQAYADAEGLGSEERDEIFNTLMQDFDEKNNLPSVEKEDL